MTDILSCLSSATLKCQQHLLTQRGIPAVEVEDLLTSVSYGRPAGVASELGHWNPEIVLNTIITYLIPASCPLVRKYN